MHYLDLSGEWRLSCHSTEGSEPFSGEISATLPGDNLTPMLRDQIVADPYVAANELDLLWLGRSDWTFRRSFTASSAMASSGRIVFRAERLDTVATVWINGTEIARSDNMFAPTRATLDSGVIVEGKNTIEIRFRGAETVAVERAEALRYPVPYAEFPIQSPHRNLVRKVQCHAGWDWGPALMVCGAYGRIGIMASEQPLLVSASAVPLKRDRWQIDVLPEFAGADPGAEIPMSVVVTDPGGTVCAEKSGTVRPGESFGVTVPEAQLWWPYGMGDQPLYTVRIQANEDVIERRVGFRELSVDLTPDDEGTNFAFVVNGRPFFAKGANWIPIDAMPSRTTDDELVWLLQSARDANMNMLRVWGGGTYESERFYDLCDEMGLLIWQDFMFACSMYPSDEWFLESVRDEVTYQVRRLRDRACIAIWCGNNENVGALGWFDVTKKNRDRYMVDYDRLNEGVVGRICRREDPSRVFWPSSPTDGPDEYSDDWKADQRGDMHYWSVWHGGEPFGSYRSVIPRFCSEFGFQSFPSRSAVASYARPEHLSVTAPDMEHHQRNPRGNTLIMHTMARYYRFPESLDDQLYMSQVQQANAISTAVEYWRSQRPRSMGALFWQINDNWPVASWSSIEYGGKWKLLQYEAQRFFAPQRLVAVPLEADGSPKVNEDTRPAGWRIYVVNDKAEALAGMVQLTWIGFDGTRHATISGEHRSFASDTSSVGLEVHAATLPGARERLFALVEFVGDSGVAGELSTWTFLDHPKRCELSPAKLRVEGKDDRIVVSTDVPAFEVGIDTGTAQGRLSANKLLVLPEAPVTITWTSRNGMRLDPAALVVNAINNIGYGG